MPPARPRRQATSRQRWLPTTRGVGSIARFSRARRACPDRDGLSFEVSYLADRAARARFEAEAYRCNLEMHFWRYGTTPSARRLAELLRDYGCREEDVDVAAHSLALANVSIRQGAVFNEATRAALDWLDANAARLRVPQ